MKRGTFSLLPSSPPSTLRPPPNRRGAFLIVAMICLLLTSGLMGTLLKMAHVSRRQSQMEAASLQAEWLAESALDRAAAKLAGDNNYPGETWTIPAEDFGGMHAGQVIITVKPAPNNDQRAVEVTARFPLEGPRTAQRTKRLSMAVHSAKVEETPENTPATAEKR